MSDIIARALANLRVTSRTAKGVSDTTSAPGKKKLVVAEGTGLASKAEENFVLALTWALEQRLEMPKADDVERFVLEVAARVSDGLLDDGESLLREHETKFEMQTRVIHIREALAGFFRELAEQLCNNHDPVATAAWVEWRLDARIHPFTDGCGRSTKVIAYWVLVRAGLMLPTYESRDRYYQLVVLTLEEWTAYYRTLFA